jgi:hypothetical protein
MRTSLGSSFLSPSSGEGSAHADRLYLFAWLCAPGLSWYAPSVARAPSAHLLLAPLHARRFSRVQDPGRACQGDAREHHRVALWPRAQRRLLAGASPRARAGAGPLDHLASSSARAPGSLWRWQPRGHTRPQASGGAKRAEQQAASLVVWPALRLGEGGVGRLSWAGAFSAPAAQTPCSVSS